jgi:hypothetical protein
MLPQPQLLMLPPQLLLLLRPSLPLPMAGGRRQADRAVRPAVLAALLRAGDVYAEGELLALCAPPSARARNVIC